MLSRRSLSHIFQARLAIGSAFQSIKGRLTATTTGLALKAISSDTVGSASGKRFETAGRRIRVRRTGAVCEFGDQHFMSARLTCLKALQQRAQQRLMSRIVFQHQAGAVIVDARRLDSGLAAEPTEESLGQRTLVT